LSTILFRVQGGSKQAAAATDYYVGTAIVVANVPTCGNRGAALLPQYAAHD